MRLNLLGFDNFSHLLILKYATQAQIAKER